MMSASTVDHIIAFVRLCGSFGSLDGGMDMVAVAMFIDSCKASMRPGMSFGLVGLGKERCVERRKWVEWTTQSGGSHR